MERNRNLTSKNNIRDDMQGVLVQVMKKGWTTAMARLSKKARGTMVAIMMTVGCEQDSPV
jgi:hypothetical protein